jgi:WD40 repeat protein
MSCSSDSGSHSAIPPGIRRSGCGTCTPTRKLARHWPARPHEIGHVAFSPDGRTLAANDSKTIQLWNDILWQDFRQLRTEVCNIVGTGLVGLPLRLCR